jgi:pimeloyl-ACP methyl ester carboxylesterase
VWRHWLETLAADYQLVRYDERGSGLSDWQCDDISLETWVKDLESLVDSLSLEQFPLLGLSQGGAVAVAYAARHPERVTQLIILGGFAKGWLRQGSRTAEQGSALMTLAAQAWGRDNPAFRQVFTSLFMPEATSEQMRWFNELQRVSATPENAVRIVTAIGDIDVVELAQHIAVPTLVLHSRDDAMIPFSAGRRLAALIPGARFVPLQSQNHLLQEGEPAWGIALREIERFLGKEPRAVPQSAANGELPEPTGDDGEARSVVASLDRVQLANYSVVGGYTRYSDAVRNALKDASVKIIQGCRQPSRKRENHLIWAFPGTGKTYFVQQVAQAVEGTKYQEINLAKCTENEFRALLATVESAGEGCLCLIDEVDAKPEAPWPYEALLPYLDAAAERGAKLAFVLAGSSGSSLDEFKQRIAARPKGTDLLSRVPKDNQYLIAPLDAGDRILVALQQFRVAGRDLGKDVRAVERLGLFYVAVSPELSNARQLREFTFRAVERLPDVDDRLKYDHLFNPGDPENKAFWLRTHTFVSDLANTFVTIAD